MCPSRVMTKFVCRGHVEAVSHNAGRSKCKRRKNDCSRRIKCRQFLTVVCGVGQGCYSVNGFGKQLMIVRDGDVISANLAINCNRPVVPKSMPVLSVSSESNECTAEPPPPPPVDGCSLTLATLIGRPANSNPFNCSIALLASSDV
uniref:Uncharacterized protein n=1 Tax=Romanomermis culicivorax TaxID=13658 RepID=A0A915IT56_ROMCU